MVICGMAAHQARPVYGQTQADAVSAQQRDRLYQSVAHDVAELEKHGQLLKKVVKLVLPTVVHIEAGKSERLRSFGGSERIDEAGSGVIIEFGGKGYVLTNLHVIRDAAASSIKIKLYDGQELHPTRIVADRETDVAIMAVSPENLLAARIGDSDSLEIGDFVLAVGSPFGQSHSVTYGIISAKGRHGLQLGDEGIIEFQDFIQTDAAINPGNSGGPLINLRGEVVGLNTAIASASGGNEGIGFAIPINMVKFIVKQLIERGSVSRAFLGVRLDANFGPTQAEEIGISPFRGTRISLINPGSPAENAQLQVGDVVFEFDGVPIQDDNHLINVVAMTEVGKEVPVTVVRNGKHLNLRVKVGDRPRNPR
jgi:serine protease Do